MSALRFHHVFFLLMLLALVSTFSLSPERSAKITPQIQTLFAPIASPARAVGRMISERVSKSASVDPRPADAIATENESLRVLNASLIVQLEDLKRLNADRAVLGDVRKVSKVYTVIGNDAGLRESLSIGGSSLEGLQFDQPVIFIGGIVGRISQIGVAGAKVQLITDPKSALTATFGRFRAGEDGHTEFVHLKLASAATVLVQGAGNNTMVINTLTLEQAQGIQPRDRLILADDAWPANLQGYTIGEVTTIEPRPGSPLYLKITLTPSAKLFQLKDVLVVVK